MMMAIEKLTCMTEPHRKTIGWLSITGATLTFVGIVFVASLALDNRGALHTYRSHLIMSDELILDIRKGLARHENAPVVIFASRNKETVGTSVHWPLTAQQLLGWTALDIHEYGIDIIMPENYRDIHAAHVEDALNNPEDHSSKRVIDTIAIHKNQSEIPIQLTVWVEEFPNWITLNALIEPRS